MTIESTYKVSSSIIVSLTISCPPLINVISDEATRASTLLSLTCSHINLGRSLPQQYLEVVPANVLVSTRSHNLPE
jgi:hypothetical protein